MKLKDKFDNPIMRHDLGRNNTEETKEQCAEIADEHAIEVLKWASNSNYSYNFGIKMFERRDREVYKTPKELLEIYKKQQGL